MSMNDMHRDPAMYDASTDPALIELAKNLSTCKATAEEVWEAFQNAEPEQQLCVICLLEVSTPGEPLMELKRDAVNRLLAKVGSPLTV